MDSILEQLVPIFAIVFGCAIVLVPVIGLTLRFTLKPTIESWMKLKAQNASPQVDLLDKRMTAVERQLEHMNSSLDRIIDEREFEKKLNKPLP